MDWQAVWDWARGVWGEDQDYGFNAFFRGVASQIAEREEWEELGSSDVWHASYHCVEQAMKDGTVSNRQELMQYVRNYQGVD